MTDHMTASASILSKVQGLIERAEHAGTPAAEAAACMERAQMLMRKYRIEQEHLLAEDPTAVTPLTHVLEFGQGSDFQEHYAYLLMDAARHAGVRYHTVYTAYGNSSQRIRATLVGYEGDLQLAEWIFTAARFAFADNLEPRNDSARSEVENVYRMRRAGLTRRETAIRMGWGDTHAAHARVAKIYKSESERRGEKAALDGRGISAQAYQKAYADEFVWALNRRLRLARDAADSVGGSLVLHGRQERVDEAFYAVFPAYRPATPTEVATIEKAPAKVKPETEAALARRIRRLEKQFQHQMSAAVQAGRRAGQAAASEVELNRASANRVDPSITAPEAIGR